MKTFRVVCTKNPEGTIIDFATADNAENSTLTHDNLLKLRQYQTPNSESLLPLLILHDNNGKIDVDFDKPEKASSENHQTLNEHKIRILSSYNRFKHRGLDSTLKITKETLALAYGFVDAHKMPPTSQQEEQLKEQILESQRLMNTRAMKKNLRTMTLRERFYKSNGD